jgi:transcriptional regulator with XRE-family HTH domain
MSNVRSKPDRSPGGLIRAFRKRAGISLDELADQIHECGVRRPSTAKLSRIETGVQPVTTDILEGLAKVTRIGRKRLRPDLAAMFSKANAA